MKVKVVICLIVTMLVASAIAADSGWQSVNGSSDLQYRWRPGLAFDAFQFKNLSSDTLTFTYIVWMEGADQACTHGGPIEVRAAEVSHGDLVCGAMGSNGNGTIDRVIVSIKSRK